jgi:anti-sigma regulatory factor (Ser/Thr protein kinase)
VINVSDRAATNRPHPRLAVLALRAAAMQAREARHWARSVLTCWAVDESVIDDALLVIAELSANAAQHGGHDMTAVLRLDRTTLRVSVVDTGGTAVDRPRARLSVVPAEDGRGLNIVHALALTCGIERGDGGTEVQAVLAADPADRGPVGEDCSPCAPDADWAELFAGRAGDPDLTAVIGLPHLAGLAGLTDPGPTEGTDRHDGSAAADSLLQGAGSLGPRAATESA